MYTQKLCTHKNKHETEANMNFKITKIKKTKTKKKHATGLTVLVQQFSLLSK